MLKSLCFEHTLCHVPLLAACLQMITKLWSSSWGMMYRSYLLLWYKRHAGNIIFNFKNELANILEVHPYKSVIGCHWPRGGSTNMLASSLWIISFRTYSISSTFTSCHLPMLLTEMMGIVLRRLRVTEDLLSTTNVLDFSSPAISKVQSDFWLERRSVLKAGAFCTCV